VDIFLKFNQELKEVPQKMKHTEKKKAKEMVEKVVMVLEVLVSII
jgi:hypothetical protein